MGDEGDTGTDPGSATAAASGPLRLWGAGPVAVKVAACVSWN